MKNHSKYKFFRRKKSETAAFTLVEVMITVGILVFVVVGLLKLFIYSSVLVQECADMTRAVASAQTQMEEIRQSDYALITTNYISGGTPGNKFDPTSLNGKGVIYLDSSNANLLQVTVVVCWRETNQRLFGEDTDLDGNLDVGEDKNGNGALDSPATLITYIAKR